MKRKKIFFLIKKYSGIKGFLKNDPITFLIFNLLQPELEKRCKQLKNDKGLAALAIAIGVMLDVRGPHFLFKFPGNDWLCRQIFLLKSLFGKIFLSNLFVMAPVIFFDKNILKKNYIAKKNKITK